MSGPVVEVQRAAVHSSLHALSQPLTVVSLALSLAQGSTSEEERALALETATAECQRAMQAVHQLRSLMEKAVSARQAPNTLPALITAEALRTGDIA